MPDYIKARNEANKLLKKFNITEPPINPVEIARRLGVEVNFVTFEKEFNNISGFYDSDDDSIYVNEDEYPLRQTFTIAHELGHRVLHREWAASNDYQMLMRDDSVPKNDIEREADSFAGHLLVPRNILDQFVEQLGVTSLSKLFAVSVPVIKIRSKMEYGY